MSHLIWCDLSARAARPRERATKAERGAGSAISGASEPRTIDSKYGSIQKCPSALAARARLESAAEAAKAARDEARVSARAGRCVRL